MQSLLWLLASSLSPMVKYFTTVAIHIVFVCVFIIFFCLIGESKWLFPAWAGDSATASRTNVREHRIIRNCARRADIMVSPDDGLLLHCDVHTQTEDCSRSMRMHLKCLWHGLTSIWSADSQFVALRSNHKHYLCDCCVCVLGRPRQHYARSNSYCEMDRQWLFSL